MRSGIRKTRGKSDKLASIVRIHPANSNELARAHCAPKFEHVPHCSFAKEDVFAQYIRAEARIGDFPTRSSISHEILEEAPPVETVSQTNGALLRLRLVRSGFALSVLCHLLLGAALAFLVLPKPQNAEIEGAMTVTIVMEGTSDADQQMAGESEAVDEPVDKVEPEPVTQHVEKQEQASLPTATDILDEVPLAQIGDKLPDILTAMKPAPEKIAIVAHAATKDDHEPELKQPEKRQVKPKQPEKKLEKPKKELKPKKKERNKQAGNRGAQTTNSRRSSDEAENRGKMQSQASNGAGLNSQAGNAARSNYAGLVQKKLNRARGRIRVSRKGSLVIAFIIQANGSVSKASIAKSSGDEKLDAAALAMLEKAAPFPAIPEETGRSSWKMTVPVDFR